MGHGCCRPLRRPLSLSVGLHDPQGLGMAEVAGPDFRLTRSRHPSASRRRIGSWAGAGLAARRDGQYQRVLFGGAVVTSLINCKAPEFYRCSSIGIYLQVRASE